MRLLIESLFLILLGVLGISEGIRLQKGQNVIYDLIGPGEYVFFISAALFVTAVAYLVIGLKRRKLIWPKRHDLRLGIANLTMAALGLYAAIVPMIGYMIGSVLFFIIGFYIFGVRSRVRNILYGVIVGLAFKFFFVNLAGVPLY